MALPAELFDALVAELAELLAPRLAAELAVTAEPGAAAAEPWRLLSEEEAAAVVGRSASWVRTRARRGELAFVKLDGGGRMYDREDLHEFAEARRVPPAEGSVLAGRWREPSQPASLSARRAARQVDDRRVDRS